MYICCKHNDTSCMWGMTGLSLLLPERMEQTSLQRSIFKNLRDIQDKAENAPFKDM